MSAAAASSSREVPCDRGDVFGRTDGFQVTAAEAAAAAGWQVVEVGSTRAAERRWPAGES